jgi:hypothetical protein
MTTIYEFGIRPDGIGWWTVDDMDGGELYFEDNILIDYDGCYTLPKEVCELLKAAGYTLDEFIED